ncbi:hypothetical protein [Streptomyces sp. NBC_01497]|uniref:hypothetical protein n=1 Tax=Streptomyces sp. NBC_01497 TaxID=2903885 RepID=UPI002E35824A|nr:hypothetical protein [Streptomyces sp. NBC_01497]
MGLKEQFQDKADRMKDEARKRGGEEEVEPTGGPSDARGPEGREHGEGSVRRGAAPRPSKAPPRAQAGEAGERMRDESDREADRAEGGTEAGRERPGSRFPA